MKPEVICHMMGSIDGGLHPSRYTSSPDGERKDWSALYEHIHAELAGDAWLVGRVTMSEMSKAEPHPPAQSRAAERPVHIARTADSYAVALDRSGKLHFSADNIGGDHVIVLLGSEVSDAHLAELVADGISYLVAQDEDMAIAPLLEALSEHFGIQRLLLEGGGEINGRLLAAGVVDLLSVLIAPALDGGKGARGVATTDGGLAGKVELSFLSAETLDKGVVRLIYRVLPPR
ncbi:riboflavin deaminase [Sphingomonas sp. AP4-R1]|uniref:RibD family protein n=1 Tax=Sphingomonas sp. AP4-R1 TaxID=2735134 RepID=UPI001493CFA2|nr:dihydrofolate reductase family protein [Sphingomonas sp. AP4-R1]QJU57378.1 riboflavin deaminase [Sphingomonas sp. AP4-R1]